MDARREPLREVGQEDAVSGPPEDLGRADGPSLADGPQPPAARCLPEGLYLRQTASGLALASAGMELRADFSSMLPRLRPDRLHRELLVRAAKLRGLDGAPTAVDGTAGLGEDSLLLATAGYKVTLFERDPVIAALLADGLARAAGLPDLAPIVARMDLRVQDSVDGLGDLGFVPDLVFLDPMFPARRKDAATRKKLQVLRLLEAPAADEEALLAAALAAGPRKVVVKRPLKGPYLAGKKPSYQLRGKVVRYDCIVVPR